MAKNAFDKFIKKEPKGAKKKELLKQQKRKSKAESRAAGDEIRRKKAEAKNFGSGYKNREDHARQDMRDKRSGSATARFKGYGKEDEIKAKDEKNAAFGQVAENGPMPLNKFIAHCGVCGRREAAEIIRAGEVLVNGIKVEEPGYKVSEKDKIMVKGKLVFLQQNLVYILINKPKDYLTTTHDPQGRKTVFDIIKNATKERVFSVGRLDRNTTGVLLMTNDGELTQKLTHPSFGIKKIYEVVLETELTKKDFEQIINGFELEDGFIKADSLAYGDSKDKRIIGIEVHSGRNRIVRRIFEHLGYKIKSLDRVMFANLTKKNVDRGKWRYLTEKEVRLLKFMNQSFLKKF